MLSSCPRFFVFFAVLLLAACSSAPRNGESPSQAPAPAKTAPKDDTPAGEKKVLCPPEPMPTLKAGEFAVWIDSEPEGGTVVVDGKPVGRTPQMVVLNGTARGFCREDISIKVRFVAEDSDHTSQTVEEVLTQLDKIPARVRFTAQGATRVAR